MRATSALLAALFLNGVVAVAQAPVTPGLPPPQVVPPSQTAPVTQDPAQQPATPPQPAAPAQPATPGATAPLTRTFTANTGLLFNTVRPERVADFETVMWYLQQALASSTDARVRSQAQGWKMFRATEPGPNGTVLYVFVLDPAVPGADYGLGRILADAYPQQIRQIWAMYQASVTSGGSLLNLTPVEPMEPAAVAPPALETTPREQPGTRTPPPGN